MNVDILVLIYINILFCILRIISISFHWYWAYNIVNYIICLFPLDAVWCFSEALLKLYKPWG